MKRLFVQTRAFSKLLDELGASLQSIEREIGLDPERGDLIAGTGGVRKLRVEGFGKGKSGGFRVFYFDFAAKEKTYLIWLLSKREAENITFEQRVVIRKIIDLIKKEAQ